MTCRRLQYGRCSFVPPKGFALVKGASSQGLASAGCHHNLSRQQTPLALSLTKRAINVAFPPYSRRPEDLKLEAYPVSITLTILPAAGNSPLAYLEEGSKAFQAHLHDLQVHFCRGEQFGKYSAACSQYSFRTTFNIFLLNFCWLLKQELITATMTVTESGVEKGWMELRSFVATVKL